jgi:hypothetical protein
MSSIAPAESRGPTRFLWRDRYGVAAWVMFALMVMLRFKGDTVNHEQVYLLGPQRVADPSFLAHDFTWGELPPTSWLHDHLMAPLFLFLGEFAVANVGRVLTWWFLAWTLALLARQMRIPPWSVVAGFFLWMTWGQSFAYCGWLLEGFQVKSFSYPLMFLSIVFAMRGQTARAGAAAGLGTAFHVIVGGWGCLALFLAMVVRRSRYTLRQLALFLVAAAPFILPVLLAAGVFHAGGLSAGERHYMDEIYVTFAAPHCCDVDWFMSLQKYVRAGLVFVLAPLLMFRFRGRDEVRTLGWFVVALISFFGLAFVAQRLEAYSVLKLFPGQLAKALPALFAFVFFAAHVAGGRAVRGFSRRVWVGAVLAVLILVDDRDAILQATDAPMEFVEEVRSPDWGQPDEHRALFEWIRTSTPEDAVFVTPMIDEFWPYARRAQVASMRHMPFDAKLIEWKERLEAINGFQPFENRGWTIRKELAENSGRLTREQLVRIRDLYGATHYMTETERRDLARYRVHSEDGYGVYDIRELDAREDSSRPPPRPEPPPS